MGEGVTIDARTHEALARLTDNEKECLKRRLRHQTAKEMALDLGISPHAVEKRLKMARAKLGLSSSLEVARLLAAAEGYQRSSPQAPDLDNSARPGKGWFTKPLTLGVLSMSIFAAFLVAFSAQMTGGATQDDASARQAPISAGSPGVPVPGPREMELRRVSPERAREYLETTFDRMDRDDSGFIERHEGPGSITLPAPAPGERSNDAPQGGTILTSDDAWNRYLADSRDDGDGKVSYDEFHAVMYPPVARNGIPLIPIDRVPLPADQSSR